MSSASRTEAACRDFMNRLEDAVRKSLAEKIVQDHFDEICMYVHMSFQTTFFNYLEEADRLPQETMNTLHHHTSGLVNEDPVNTALQEQKDFIIQNITSIVKNTVDGQDEFTPYLATELTGSILLHFTQDFHTTSRVSISTHMPTRSSYHLRNSSITFECSTACMETERNMSATAENVFSGICNMAVCQWKVQRQALLNLSRKRGSSSMTANNSGDDICQNLGFERYLLQERHMGVETDISHDGFSQSAKYQRYLPFVRDN
jgi:ribosomal protein S7